MEKSTKEIILEQEKLGNVVFITIDGIMGMDLDEFITQPAEGMLYDLNRDKVTCITLMNEDEGNTWVNNYAVALVIEKLKDKIIQLEEELGMRKNEKKYEGYWNQTPVQKDYSPPKTAKTDSLRDFGEALKKKQERKK